MGPLRSCCFIDTRPRRASQGRYTSEAMLAAEVEAMATVSAERERPIGGIGKVEQLRVMHSRDASGRTLDAEQKVAVEHLTSPGLHRALVAPAGAERPSPSSPPVHGSNQASAWSS